LEKLQDQVARDIVNMLGFTVGILGSEGHIATSVKRNLDTYVTYTGAKFVSYTEDDILQLDENSLPDVLFIDHIFHQRKGELEKYLDLPCKTILLTTAEKKKTIEFLLERVDRVLYKPLNLTKTLKALEVVYEEKVKKTSKLQDESRSILFKNLHIMVAEDNTINQKLIKNVLNGFGIDVTLANNGEEALNLRMQNEYDMIFMDIQMPVLGGIEATHKIIEFEEKNRKRHIPIVALTANALSGDREKYMGEGMDNYLSKPIDLERLNILLQEYFPSHVKKVEGSKDDNKRMDEIPQQPSSETEELSYLESKPKELDTQEVQLVPEVIDEEDEVSIIESLLITTEEKEDEIPLSLESETEPNEVSEEVSSVPSKPHNDILIYHSFSLIANLYERILQNLGYSVDKVIDETEFMDRIEDTMYRFVLFDGKPLMNIQCLASEMIRDAGAIPFVILTPDLKDQDFCCDVLEEGSDVELIREALEKAEIS
jgi:CheY-like chemotaxis protein